MLAITWLTALSTISGIVPSNFLLSKNRSPLTPLENLPGIEYLNPNKLFAWADIQRYLFIQSHGSAFLLTLNQSRPSDI
jgi:hypothetical protein